MGLLSQLFGKYSLLAKAIYEKYLQDKEPLTKADVDQAVSQYEKDHNKQIVPYAGILKRKILKKDFTPPENYYRTRVILKERWQQMEQTKRRNEELKRAFIAETDAVIRELKEDIIEDKVFISEILCFSLALAYKKEHRRYNRLMNNKAPITDFFTVSPEHYRQFKIQKIKALIRSKGDIPKNHYKRIITQTMRFIKGIERR